MGIIFCLNAWKLFWDRYGEKMENQIFPHYRRIPSTFIQTHPRSSSSVLFPLFSDRPFALPLAKHVEDLGPWDPCKYSFHGFPGTTFLLVFYPLYDQRLFPWWEMWEEFWALVLRSVHCNHSSVSERQTALCSCQNSGYWACLEKDSSCRRRCLQRLPLFYWTRRTSCAPQTCLGVPSWDESLHLGDWQSIEALPAVEQRNIPLHWASTAAMSLVTWRNCPLV